MDIAEGKEKPALGNPEKFFLQGSRIELGMRSPIQLPSRHMLFGLLRLLLSR
jgi:hypothetical protein